MELKYILMSLIILLSCCQCLSLVEKERNVERIRRAEDPGAGNDAGESSGTVVKSTADPINKKNDTNNNETATPPPTLYGKILENKDMLMRTFYVLIAVTSVVVIYFVIRAWRTRRRRSKSRKYGLITSSGADLEMEPLDRDDDDDDDMTVFERTK